LKAPTSFFINLRNLLLFSTLIAIRSIQAQLGIGDTSPSEILDLESIPALLGENKFYISMNDFTSGRYYIVLIDPLNKQISTSYIKEN
jgi:hypothetical protein